MCQCATRILRCDCIERGNTQICIIYTVLRFFERR